MKLIYKPFGIIFGILAGILSKKLFEAVWGIFDKEEPPKPTTQETTWPKVIGAAVVEGVTFKVTRAAVDRVGAKGFAARHRASGPARSSPTRARPPRPSARAARARAPTHDGVGVPERLAPAGVGEAGAPRRGPRPPRCPR